MTDPLARWHAYIDAPTPDALNALLHDDVVFHSPVVHTPQRGKALTFAYLWAASETLGSDSFEYLREVVDANTAVLEFRTEMDGIAVNGVDMIEWDESGLITDFKVMVRPLQAMDIVHRKMGERLASMKASR
ncbi:nuclear transport factor 2 family protein [uncultured Algimonas sp.]|uniref:nuclear transport factor 2 family protein n=1 Tax=uncultured Algimonas sp. TaxID=1547920 RepID=UPI00261D8E92|nr:nuclear transport factor 2 family protein [uncultured Algimonas sp.]